MAIWSEPVKRSSFEGYLSDEDLMYVHDTLILAGLDLTSSFTAPITVKKDSAATVEILNPAGFSNTLSDQELNNEDLRSGEGSVDTSNPEYAESTVIKGKSGAQITINSAQKLLPSPISAQTGKTINVVHNGTIVFNTRAVKSCSYMMFSSTDLTTTSGWSFVVDDSPLLVEECAHSSRNTVTENETKPGCETAGCYDQVTYCLDCGEELSRATVSVDPTGHCFVEWIQEEAPGYCRKGSEVCTCSAASQSSVPSRNSTTPLPMFTREAGTITRSCGLWTTESPMG